MVASGNFGMLQFGKGFTVLNTYTVIIYIYVVISDLRHTECPNLTEAR